MNEELFEAFEEALNELTAEYQRKGMDRVEMVSALDMAAQQMRDGERT